MVIEYYFLQLLPKLITMHTPVIGVWAVGMTGIPK